MSSFFIILSRTVEFVPSEKRKMVTVVHLGLIYQVAKEKWGKDDSYLFIIVSLTAGCFPHGKAINA